jgi:hypothetical protein
MLLFFNLVLVRNWGRLTGNMSWFQYCLSQPPEGWERWRIKQTPWIDVIDHQAFLSERRVIK